MKAHWPEAGTTEELYILPGSPFSIPTRPLLPRLLAWRKLHQYHTSHSVLWAAIPQHQPSCWLTKFISLGDDAHSRRNLPQFSPKDSALPQLYWFLISILVTWALPHSSCSPKFIIHELRTCLWQLEQNSNGKGHHSKKQCVQRWYQHILSLNFLHSCKFLKSDFSRLLQPAPKAHLSFPSVFKDPVCPGQYQFACVATLKGSQTSTQMKCMVTTLCSYQAPRPFNCVSENVRSQNLSFSSLYDWPPSAWPGLLASCPSPPLYHQDCDLSKMKIWSSHVLFCSLPSRENGKPNFHVLKICPCAHFLSISANSPVNTLNKIRDHGWMVPLGLCPHLPLPTFLAYCLPLIQTPTAYLYQSMYPY